LRNRPARWIVERCNPARKQPKRQRQNAECESAPAEQLSAAALTLT
jgi:hypothetical protein